MANDTWSSPEYIGWKLQVFIACFAPLQVIAVVLRFYARWLIAGTKFAIDDALVLVSLFIQLGLSAIAFASIHNAGVGYHLHYLENHDPAKLHVWGKYLLAMSTINLFGVNIPKLAILVFYRKLFPMKSVRITISVLAAILIISSLANTIISLAACRPFEANYRPFRPGKQCLDKTKFFLWTSLPSIVTDVVMLILPLPIVWRIHNTTRTKVALTFTFLFGSIGLLTAILRFHGFFVTAKEFQDATYDAVKMMTWVLTESGIYLISACLLTYRPILERISNSRAMNILRHSTAGSKRTGDVVDENSKHGREGRVIALKKVKRGSLCFTKIDNGESTETFNIKETDPDAFDKHQDGKIRVTTDIEHLWSPHSQRDT